MGLADDWPASNQPLFTYQGNEYRLVYPEGYVKLIPFTYAKPLELVAAPWHAAQISLGWLETRRKCTRVGRNPQDEKSLHNVVVPTGHFRGGWMRLWQPEMEIEVSRGEALLFNGRSVAYDVSEIKEGVRDVVDFFIHHSNFCDRERKRKERVGEEVLAEEGKKAREMKLRKKARARKKEKARQDKRAERKKKTEEKN